MKTINMKLLILLTTFIFSAACSHHKLINETHVPGSCSDKIKNIKPPPGQKIIDLTKQSTAGPISIAIAGVGAATDALVIIISSPVTKFTLCVATISIALSGHQANTDICNDAMSPSYNPKLTQKILNNTKAWRCQNLDYISEGLRNVASCYAEKNEKDKAKLQLESILNNKTISSCISQNETNIIKESISKL